MKDEAHFIRKCITTMQLLKLHKLRYEPIKEGIEIYTLIGVDYKML